MYQIIGTKKCNETGKLLRFFKERSIPFQFVDLKERSLSEGELNSVIQALGNEAEERLVDKTSKIYQKKGFSYMEYDFREELLDHPELMSTPVLRQGPKALVGYDPDKLKEFLANS